MKHGELIYPAVVDGAPPSSFSRSTAPSCWTSKVLNIMHEFEEERDPLQKQLGNIEQIFQEFADQYETAATSLRQGFVPEPIPSIQLDAARKVVNDTFDAISEAGEPFNMEPLSGDSSLTSAGEYLEKIIEARMQAEKKKRLLDDAIAIVRDIEALGHSVNPDELNIVKTAAEEMRKELDDQNLAAAEQLLGGNHPMAMLAAYSRHRETLNDDEYDDFRQKIELEFGRSLLRDIDRGRIIIESGLRNSEIAEHIESIPTIMEEAAGLIEEEIQDTSPYDPIEDIEIDEELLEETKIDDDEDSLPPMYSDFDAGEGEDTLLPFLEGDGMNFDDSQMPEATVNSADQEKDEEDEEEENN